MKNEKRYKKHRHFCIVALFFSLPKEMEQGADHRPVSRTNALCALFKMTDGETHRRANIPPFLPLFRKKRKSGGYASVLSLWRECEHRIRLVAERLRPAFCLLGGQKPCTHFMKGDRL